MAIESASFISDLVITNPVSSDDRSTADDHLRLMKSVIKKSLPNAGVPSIVNSLAATGPADVYAVTLDPAATAYASGMFIRFIVPAANTGAATLNVNALGAKSIKRAGAALVAGDLPINAVVEVIYDGTNFQVIGGTQGIFPGSLGLLTIGTASVTSLSVTSTATVGNLSVQTAATLASLSVTSTATIAAAASFGKEVYFDEVVDNGNSSTADTIDWKVGNKQLSTLTGACTYTFTAPSGPANLVLKLIQGGSGSYNPTWPASVKWVGGVEPSWSTAVSAVDIVTFFYDGTNYYGSAGIGFA